jgi:hypothetical protein
MCICFLFPHIYVMLFPILGPNYVVWQGACNGVTHQVQVQ